MNGTFEEIIASDEPVLLEFYTDWCKPCKKMAPELNAVKDIFGDDLTIIKIDAEKNMGLKKHLKVDSVPTLILYQKGKQLWRQAGGIYADKLERVIREKVRF
ncbi:thioredoxin family protein [Siphonobacter curvatus]|uniref:Thioredoxin n=1 Tax=Siphonobacter curvatus TaxID=2094562 RepID=A0A2S7IM79_9BACT|nr:thioredoxin family protein [Siphonobacter curvatus]PQA58660.1 thiol reductase thioredoxin [Siphonobacter curvatus]